MSNNGYNAPGRQATPTPNPVAQPVPTPPLGDFTQPSTMVTNWHNRYWPALPTTGGFRIYERVAELMGSSAHGTPRQFNCFAWSLGFTDRWLEGGDVAVMERLYTEYFMMQCSRVEAEVDLYRILDAPAGIPRAWVMHAHRRDDASLDNAGGLGCSSKMADGALILHNRLGLTDNRGASVRAVKYGEIYQHWRRNPDRHPYFTGEGIGVYPAQGHRPEHKIFELGPGRYPYGHPGNSIGAPALAPPEGNNSGGGGATKTSRSAPAFKAESGKNFAHIAGMKPYDKIPAPSAAAVDAAKKAYTALRSKDAGLVKSFDAKWLAWSKLWFPKATGKTDEPTSGPSSTLESTEFKVLAKLGAKLVPLIVYKLSSDPAANFPGVFLYNAVETERDYRVSSRDVVNYCVLQRQANLIVEMNAERTGGGGAATTRGMGGGGGLTTTRGMPGGGGGATTRGMGGGGGGTTTRGMPGGDEEPPAKQKGMTRRAAGKVGRVMVCGLGGARRRQRQKR